MKPRGMLIANPQATSTSAGMRDVITRALGHEIDLEVVTTTHRGHAEQLASESNGLDLLIDPRGDGRSTRRVNGMLNSRHRTCRCCRSHPRRLCQCHGPCTRLPNDAIEATGMILESLRTDASHDVGLGNAHFTQLETGRGSLPLVHDQRRVGIDADVIASMEAQRAAGRAASPTRYVWTAAQQYFGDVGAGVPHR